VTPRRTKPWRRSSRSDLDKMSLPAGKTCADCFHVDRCTAFFGHIPEDEVCDFSPSRFAFVRRMVAGDIGIAATS
jgi:hypothetical protein